MSKTQRIEKLKQDYDTTSQVANITYKINEIIDFIQPKEEATITTSSPNSGYVYIEPQIDQYTVDKILEKIDDNFSGVCLIDEVLKIVESFKN